MIIQWEVVRSRNSFCSHWWKMRSIMGWMCRKMTEEKASQIVTYRSKGYGVRNVNERIVLLYGEENKIRVESKEGEGTRVCIRIPKKKENGHEKQETKN